METTNTMTLEDFLVATEDYPTQRDDLYIKVATRKLTLTEDDTPLPILRVTRILGIEDDRRRGERDIEDEICSECHDYICSCHIMEEL